jgi:hypothetical protein
MAAGTYLETDRFDPVLSLHPLQGLLKKVEMTRHVLVDVMMFSDSYRYM